MGINRSRTPAQELKLELFKYVAVQISLFFPRTDNSGDYGLSIRLVQFHNQTLECDKYVRTEISLYQSNVVAWQLGWNWLQRRKEE
jgi:hypothetical protein